MQEKIMIPDGHVLDDLDNNWGEIELIEKIWLDSNGCYSREQIREAVQKIYPTFQTARVKQFVPILIYRKTMNLLKLNSAHAC